MTIWINNSCTLNIFKGEDRSMLVSYQYLVIVLDCNHWMFCGVLNYRMLGLGLQRAAKCPRKWAGGGVSLLQYIDDMHRTQTSMGEYMMMIAIIDYNDDAPIHSECWSLVGKSTVRDFIIAWRIVGLAWFVIIVALPFVPWGIST